MNDLHELLTTVFSFVSSGFRYWSFLCHRFTSTVAFVSLFFSLIYTPRHAYWIPFNGMVPFLTTNSFQVINALQAIVYICFLYGQVNHSLNEKGNNICLTLAFVAKYLFVRNVFITQRYPFPLSSFREQAARLPVPVIYSAL